ncbi:MAG: hypothetical protein AAFV87_08130 [Pseudomonadota bacterium]
MTDPYKDCIICAHAELTQALTLLNTEIRDYPTPISGCDAQFNHLLAERQKVSAALGALDSPFFVPTPRTPSMMSGIESR